MFIFISSEAVSNTFVCFHPDSMAAAASCDVCCEKLNKSTCKPVCCNNPACTFSVCRKCTEKYLCETTQNAHCMSCRTGWNREHLEKEFTKIFLGGAYKKYRENLLFDRQKSMLPATQPLAENEKMQMALDKEIAEKRKEIAKARNHLSTLHVNFTEDPETGLRIAEEIHALRLQWVVCSEEIRFIEMKKRIISPLDRLMNGGAAAQNQKREFIKACPANECRGFLSTAWKCGLCEVWVCPDCHEVKGHDRDAEHTCKKETLETVKLLAADTRQCPKCPTMIFKIDGCNQMYCTMCHTAFCWRTGQVDTGHIHNPHHYEYLRQQATNGIIPRNPGDVPCGGAIMPLQELNVTLYLLFSPPGGGRRMGAYKPSSPQEERILKIHRMYLHIMHVELPSYIVNNHEDNQDLRIKYLINEIDEPRFKLLLQQREKKNDKKTEIHMVLSTYTAVVMDLMNSMRTFSSRDQVEALLVALDNIRTYTNTSLAPISRRYNCMVPQIEEDAQRTGSVKF